MKLDNLTSLPENANVSQIMDLANLNWNVEEAPLSYFRQGQHHSTTGSSILKVRDGVVEGELTKTKGVYTPTGNREIITQFHEFCAEAGIQVSHAGELRGGQYIAMVADLDLDFAPPSTVGDITKARLMLVGSHLCGVGHQVKLLLERLICTNGMTAPLTRTMGLLRHTQGVTEKIDGFLDESLAEWKRFTEDATLMSETPVSAEEAEILLVEALGPHRAAAIMNVYGGNMIGEDVHKLRGLWRLKQSVTEYYNHHYNYRPTTDQLGAITIGAQAKEINTAWNSISKFARQKQGVALV